MIKLMTKMNKADIGVFGGSGFYSFLKDVEYVKIDTPYGHPSDKIAISTIEGKRVAFLPRHSSDHSIPPHKLPYRANLWAMKMLGVKRIIAPTASGSLRADIKPGEFVITDQLIDRTWGRPDTFFDGPTTTHISFADPYCPQMRQIAIEVGKKLNLPIHEKGTMVVIQGPRFSTRAESKWYSSMGADIINMTQYPESVLARELEMCYINISLITDYDCGLEDDPSIEPVTHEAVIKIFQENQKKLKDYIIEIVKAIPDTFTCNCQNALENASVE